MKIKSSKIKSSNLTKSSKRKSSKVSKIKKKLKSITLIHAEFKNPREKYLPLTGNQLPSGWTSGVMCNGCFMVGKSVSNIKHSPYCSNNNRPENQKLWNLDDQEFERMNKGTSGYLNIKQNPSVRKNPGGGWIFIGKYADKWDAVRGINMINDDILNKGGEFYVQIRDKKDGSWWVAIISKIRVPYDSELGREGQIAKGDNVINVKKLIREVDDRPKFSGIDALNWIDLRIGYNSRGPEILNRENIWYAANVIERSPGFFNVIDVRYPINFG